MHGYAGNPALYPAVIDMGDDGPDPPTWLTWNISFEGLADRTAYLRTIVATVNFHPSQALTVGVANSAIAYDPIALRWMVGGALGSGLNVQLLTGRGDPIAWPALGSTGPSLTPSGICRGIEPTVANKYVYVASVSIGAPTPIATPTVARLDTVASTWSQGFVEGTITDGQSIAILSVTGAVVVAVGAASAGHSNVFSSVDHGSTWTAQTVVTISVAVPRWLLAQSVPGAGTILAIPVLATGPTYLSSPDGVTWTSQPGLAGLFRATETPQALAFATDGYTPCWVLTTIDTATTTTNTYRSYDGVTWAAFANNLPVGVALLQVAAVGQLLVAGVFEIPYARILQSLDGGATWTVTGTALPAASAQVHLGSSFNQFLAMTSTAVVPSLCYGPAPGIGLA